MKKIYLFSLICTLIACQDDIAEDIESVSEFDGQETIVLDGTEVTLNFREING
ncbi:hypothetical protein HME9304_00401 [Flagellimonas maritima]|uniref:Uncharacterized protein n=1 Tax=Flagellimonas maritima TaxID=1383885 RepID=A0A2Z4LNT4_9FLAO|nr:hypothetical protein [Allomuricauda aurantiaca]AWX43413.1 hypothetical protein HME9304_00401 [Allomuricauda aurantiaca]